MHDEYASQGQTVSQHSYLEVLRRLNDAVRRKLKRKWQCGEWQIYHKNTLAHSNQNVQNFFVKHVILHVHQTLYFTDGPMRIFAPSTE